MGFRYYRRINLGRGLGLNVHHELPGPQNRPLPLVDYGVNAIAELF